MGDIIVDLPAVTATISATVQKTALSLVLDTNLQAKAATTQYMSFPVNSMAMVDGRVLCASEDGLFENTGDFDGEEQVSAFFELPLMDFGIKQIKRLRFIYLSVEASGDLTVTVSTERGLTQTITVPIDAAGQHARRIPVTRKVYGRYFTIRIGNDGNGLDFSIDEIKVLPVVLNHGTNRN